MNERPPNIVNVDDVEETGGLHGDHWSSLDKPVAPFLAAEPGRLGARVSRVPAGRTGCPFHCHLREDEFFYVISGRGVLRYGDRIDEIGPGDCISCPAGTGTAHQIANPFEEDLIFLAVGANDPHDVCTYPDSGKVMVVGLNTVGYLQSASYMHGEPDRPRIFDMLDATARNV